MTTNSSEILHHEHEDDDYEDETASSANNVGDEEEDWSDEDESDVSESETEEALIFDFESNFFDLVNKKVADTEAFFDNEHYILKYVPLRSQSKECTCKQHPQSSQDINRSAEERIFSHADCQTDDLFYVINTNDNGPPEPLNNEETARAEINHLRTAKESLVKQRKELADFRKMNPDADTDSETERKIYSCEEAIEAIDSAIDYKNEVICGHDFILSNDFAPGMVEANLISRLTTLSTSDLQRLLCKYFSKVVELRHSSKRLEAQVEDMEIRHDQVKRRVRKYQNDLRDIEDENAIRIKDIIKFYSHSPGTELSEYLQHSKSAKAARKKQQDLELSLTELLVRHGYLRDGADYDVKQVAKMLGIHPLQLQLCQVEDDDDRNPMLPVTRLTSLGSVHPSQGLSRRMREVISNRRERPGTPMGGGHRSQPSSATQAYRSHISGGHSSTTSYPRVHSHRHHYEEEHQPLSHLSRNDRHARLESSSSHRHQINNNENHYMRHGYNNNLNGHAHPPTYDYMPNDNMGANSIPDSRHESHPAQGSSHPHRSNIGADIQRQDKKITVIPRQRRQHQHR